jgi:hypothetical protein
MVKFITSGVLLVLLVIATPTIADQWAVLVAGSSQWYNYRHQSDVCHAYQILHRNGIPDDHIIVMMYDDIAYSDDNPTPGVIINQPGGPNVYPGVPHDYTKDKVTVANFIGVLMGNKSVGHKVLETGPNDDVFIYLADHGAKGLFCFPQDNDVLTATQLLTTLNWMYENQRYRQLVIYIESCESGSMFMGRHVNNRTLAEMNIYATTASTPSEPSYACYLNDTLQTYLGDCYSVAWLQNSDAANMSSETLWKQFLTVKANTNTSQVCRYGNLSIAKQPLGDFQGDLDPTQSNQANILPTRSYPQSSTDRVRADRADLMLDLHMLGKLLNQSVLEIELDRVWKFYRHLGSSIRQIQDVQTKYPFCPGPSHHHTNPCFKGIDLDRIDAWIQQHPGPWNQYELEVLRYI